MGVSPSISNTQKAQHMDDLLPSLIADATPPTAQSCPSTVAMVTSMISTNRASTEEYLEVS